MTEPTTEPGRALPWKRSAKRWRGMYRRANHEQRRVREAMRLAGVTLMVPDFRDGSERVVIRVPGEQERAAAASAALDRVKAAVEGLPQESAITARHSMIGDRYLDRDAVLAAIEAARKP